MILLTTLSQAVPWIAIAIWDSGIAMSSAHYTNHQACLDFLPVWADPEMPNPYNRTAHSDGEPVFVGCIAGDIKYHRFMLDIMTQRGKEP